MEAAVARGALAARACQAGKRESDADATVSYRVKVIRLGFEKRVMAASDASDAALSDAAAARVGEIIARLLEDALPLGPTSIY